MAADVETLAISDWQFWLRLGWGAELALLLAVVLAALILWAALRWRRQ